MQPDLTEAQMQSARSSLGHRENIPLTIVGGAPGTGKTSLVRHLLEHTAGRRTAAIVGESVEIDASLVADSDGPRVVLNNGCTYVRADDDGTAALAALGASRDRPDHVVIDRAGFADLRRMTGYGYMPGYSLNGAVLIVDASNPALNDMDGTDESHLQEQATIANVVLLNKVDLIDAERAASAQRTLERLAPATRVVWSDHGRIAPPLLLGLSADPSALDARAVLAEWRPDYLPQNSRPARTRTCENHCAWCLVADAPIDGREFRTWAQRLTGRVMSGHGTVYLRDEPQHRHVFHFLGRRWRLDRGSLWGDETPATRLLLAGEGSGSAAAGAGMVSRAQRPASRAERIADVPRAPDLGDVA
ncbi:MAG TPA: GTP-binding protein [Gemmatimonadaceae bacterium]|jgi:G3E family GTPase|nr:GTP-binding protein [Gemmatimonadaceae bacterium]